MKRRTWHLWLGAVVLFATVLALYNNWAWATLLNAHLATMRSLISEMSAQDQPYHWFFRASDIGAGILTLAFLPVVWRFTQRNPLGMSWLLPLAYAVIGADSIVDALLPIHCAPSVEAHCSLADGTSLVTQAHLAESTIIGVVAFVAAFMWWRWYRQVNMTVANVSLTFAAVQIAVGVGILVCAWLGLDITGVWQRVYEFSISAWLASIMVISLRAEAPVTVRVRATTKN